MSLIKGLIFLVLLFGCLTAEENQIEDENIAKLSQFFIELIEQYDTDGSGQIRRQDYPYFLRDIFVKGSNLSKQKQDLINTLLKATTQFTQTKDKEKETIGIQQFYDDIISHFTVFLMEKPEYSIIINELFEDIKTGEEDEQPKKEQL